MKLSVLLSVPLAFVVALLALCVTAIGCSAGDATPLPDPNHTRGVTPFPDGGGTPIDGAPPNEGGVPDVGSGPIDVGMLE